MTQKFLAIYSWKKKKKKSPVMTCWAVTFSLLQPEASSSVSHQNNTQNFPLWTSLNKRSSEYLKCVSWETHSILGIANSFYSFINQRNESMKTYTKKSRNGNCHFFFKWKNGKIFIVFKKVFFPPESSLLLFSPFKTEIFLWNTGKETKKPHSTSGFYLQSF